MGNLNHRRGSYTISYMFAGKGIISITKYVLSKNINVSGLKSVTFAESDVDFQHISALFSSSTTAYDDIVREYADTTVLYAPTVGYFLPNQTKSSRK